MLLKVFLVTASVLVLTQALRRQKEGSVDAVRAMIGFVEIANATYFLDTVTGYYRDDTKTLCESLNMTMIAFEADLQKWRTINKWLNENGNYNHNFFWTEALKNEGSSKWFWETSGNSLTENDFYWGVGQPSMAPNETVRSCINFSYTGGGYDDDDCLDFKLGVFCEYKTEL